MKSVPSRITSTNSSRVSPAGSPDEARGVKLRDVKRGPNAWPPPGAATLSVDRSVTVLELPELAGPPPVADAPSFPPSTRPQVDPREHTDEGWSEWRVTDNNRRARYYSLTASGRRYLNESLTQWRRMSRAINLVLDVTTVN